MLQNGGEPSLLALTRVVDNEVFCAVGWKATGQKADAGTERSPKNSNRTIMFLIWFAEDSLAIVGKCRQSHR